MSDFDPSIYLTSLKGKPYLEVKWRLVWLREVHPTAQLETGLHAHTQGEAVFWCKITIPSGASATGWGSETKSDFGDYLEKAETKAIGRACAALGFGTQFCDDHVFDPDQKGKVVDSPVDFSRPRPPASEAATHDPPPDDDKPKAMNPDNAGKEPTERQLNTIKVMVGRMNLDPKHYEPYTRQEASNMIGDLIARQNAVASNPRT